MIFDAAFPVAVGAAAIEVNASGLSGLGSPQRVKEIEQSHLRYSRWQSSHPTRGEYQSRPQANVVRTVVKFAIYEIRGFEISSGILVAVYVVSPLGGAGSGTVYATAGQYGNECTRGQLKAAVKQFHSVSIQHIARCGGPDFVAKYMGPLT